MRVGFCGWLGANVELLTAEIRANATYDCLVGIKAETGELNDVLTLAVRHLLLVLIASATNSELAKPVEDLKYKNEILRSRLPKPIHTSSGRRVGLAAAVSPRANAKRSGTDR